MKPADFEFLTGLLKRRSGIVISADKLYLLENRLASLIRTRNLNGLEGLVSLLRSGNDEELLREITEAITTNETYFFRDRTPFEQFQNVMLPRLDSVRPAGKPIRVWCAAASTGQEPYSLSIAAQEEKDRINGRQVEFMATDIDRTVLERARGGVYSQFEVQRGLPIKLLVKYFEKVGDMWRIDPKIRDMVRFEYFNLLDNMEVNGKFDIIFCRNVLIYFDPQTKKSIIDRMAQQLAPDGYLVLGASETILGITDHVAPMAETRGLYAPVPAAEPRRGAAMAGRV